MSQRWRQKSLKKLNAKEKEGSEVTKDSAAVQNMDLNFLNPISINNSSEIPTPIKDQERKIVVQSPVPQRTKIDTNSYNRKKVLYSSIDFTAGHNNYSNIVSHNSTMPTSLKSGSPPAQ